MRIIFKLLGAGGFALAVQAHAAAVSAAGPASDAGQVTFPAPDAASLEVPKDDHAALDRAAQLIHAGQPREAIDSVLDPLLASLLARHANAKGHLYCASNPTEALSYMLKAAGDHAGAATAIDNALCDAYFLRGFAKIDLGRVDDAQADYERALAMAPNNPHYLSEMADLRLRHRDWEGAIALFQRAADAAPALVSESRRNAELGRALRGIGYAEVELGLLERAQARYQRCLEIDPHDEKARGELGYVQDLMRKRGG